MPKIISFPDVPGKEFEVGDDFTPSDAEELYDLYRPESSTIRRVIGDTAVGLAKGVVALPQSVAGLVDIGTGLAGVGSFTKTIKPVVDFQMTQDVLSEFYSPEAKRSQKALQSAKGLTDTVSTVLKNPSIIQQQISESLPQMLGGASAAGKMAAKGVGRAVAAGAGEGLITAGQQAVGIEEATGDELSRKQAGLALVSGVFTGALGSFGNKVADKLGLVDINLLTSSGTSEAVKRGIVARAIGGAITEGALEELPQSVQEQIAQNIATDKPWNEGLAQAGVIGTVVGGLMGGAAQALPRGQAPSATVPSAEPTTPTTPTTPPTAVDRISTNIEEALSDKGIKEALSEIPAEEVLTSEPEVAPVAPEVAAQEPEVAPITPEVAAPIQEVAPETTAFVPPEPNLLPLTTQVLQEQLLTVPESVVTEPAVEPTTQGEPNALQEPPATESLLGQTRPELGLPQVVQGNTQQEVAAEEGQKEEVKSQPKEPWQMSAEDWGIELREDNLTPYTEFKEEHTGTPIFDFQAGRKLTYSDFIRAPKLFEKFPELANKRVVLIRYNDGYSASDSNRTRIVSDTTLNSFTKHLLHELFHDIQRLSGKEAGADYRAEGYRSNASEKEAREFQKAAKVISSGFVYEDGKYVRKPPSPTVANVTEDDAIDRAISALESNIKPPSDTTQAVIIPGLDPATGRAVWNTALRIAIGVLKATKNIQRAIQAGINHIKKELAARRLTLSAAQEDELRQSMEGEVAYKKGVLQRAALNVVRGTALPKSMVEARRRQLDHQKFIEESIKLKSEDAKAAINAEFKTAADREAATNRLSRFLSGAIPVRAVGGPEVQLRAAALRASIDNLSLLAVNESMVTGDMATTWLGNMGEWLKRTYLAFDSTADWNYDTLQRRNAKGDVEINRIWKAAHDFLSSQNPKWDEARIEAEMRSLIDRVTVEDVLGIQSKSTPGSGPKLSTEISSLLQRKDIPVEIRDWMGEIKDPYARVLQSGKWLAQFITRNLAQRELATIGLETGVLSEKKSGRYTEELFPNQLDFIPQRDPVTGEVVKDAAGNPLGQYSTRVDRRHEPLAGYWTTPEFRDALEEFDSRLNNTIATLSFGSLVGKGILTGTSYQKGALVGWNPASYMVNMIGGAVLRLASGHVNPVHLFRALNAVAFGGKPISSTSTRRALLARADYLMSAKAGTTGKGILLGDIEANLSREREAGAGKRAINAIKGILSDPKAKGQWVKLKRSLDDLWRIPGDYGIRFMDDVFRASAFFDELSLAKSAFPTMPQDEQVKWAADRALNVYQNYDRLPKGLRDASRIGALNTFVSFKAEMFRNAYWIARYAKEGLSSTNPELKRDGAQKLAGLVIMTALPLVLAAMSRSKNDIEDDEDSAIKRWIVPPWDRSEELVYISGKDGKYTYVPLGYLLPTFEYTRPFTTIWNAANDPNPDEAVKKALSGWASDYLGPGAFLGPIFEAASNRRIGAEKKISMKEGMGGVKERVSHVTESFTPRGIRMLEEAYKAYNKIPGDFAKEYSMDEIAAKLAGLRERRVDVHKAAPFVLLPFGYRWREASSDENLQSRKYPPGSPEALEAKRYEAETKARLKILYRQAITDLKRLGVTQAELYSIIQDLKLPAELRQ